MWLIPFIISSLLPLPGPIPDPGPALDLGDEGTAHDLAVVAIVAMKGNHLLYPPLFLSDFLIWMDVFFLIIIIIYFL